MQSLYTAFIGHALSTTLCCSMLRFSANCNGNREEHKVLAHYNTYANRHALRKQHRTPMVDIVYLWCGPWRSCGPWHMKDLWNLEWRKTGEYKIITWKLFDDVWCRAACSEHYKNVILCLVHPSMLNAQKVLWRTSHTRFTLQVQNRHAHIYI